MKLSYFVWQVNLNQTGTSLLHNDNKIFCLPSFITLLLWPKMMGWGFQLTKIPVNVCVYIIHIRHKVLTYVTSQLFASSSHWVCLCPLVYLLKFVNCQILQYLKISWPFKQQNVHNVPALISITCNVLKMLLYSLIMTTFQQDVMHLVNCLIISWLYITISFH